MNCFEIWNFCGVGHKKTAPKFLSVLLGEVKCSEIPNT